MTVDGVAGLGGREPADRSPIAARAPADLFGGLDDEAWRWLNLEGRELSPFLARYLPALPAEPEQTRVNAKSGTEALELGFRIYSLFSDLFAQERGALASHHRVLDFGCGWGRLTRFFLRDVSPENLVGVDIDERAVTAARATNRWCRFEVSSVLPPSSFDDESFDLIYAYSVFSHLSEEAHLRWLEEFARILKPDGVLLLTTLGRGFIERSSGWSGADAGSLALWQRQAADSLPGGGAAAYDRGEYCYGPIPGGDNPHFGFACIPEPYVMTRWSRYVEVRRWLPAPAPRIQTVIVCRQRTEVADGGGSS